MELTWEGDIAFEMTRRKSGEEDSLALMRLSPEASQEQLDDAFERDVVEALQCGHKKHVPNQRFKKIKAKYQERLHEPETLPPSKPLPRSTKPRRCGTKRAKQLRRMHNLLQSLPPDRRRCAIQALPQKMRLALEGWILQQHRPAVTKQAVGGHIWQQHCHGSGFVAAIHLGRGLHAQSAACKDLRSAARCLALLLRWHAKCSRDCASGGGPEEAKRFAQSVLEAQPRTMKLYIRARMRVTSDKRLSSPLRSDAATAVLDWLQLGIHEGDSLNPVGKETPSSDKAARRWLHASKAWMRIWKQRGRDADALQKELNSMQAQFRGALLESLKRQQCAFTEMQQLAEEHGSANLKPHRLHGIALQPNLCTGTSCLASPGLCVDQSGATCSPELM